MELADLDSLVRVGVVSVVDPAKKMCRVFFPDLEDMVSDWMPVLQRPGEKVVVKSSEGHTHEAEVGVWLPKEKARVLVVYPFGWNTNGYVVGVIP